MTELRLSQTQYDDVFYSEDSFSTGAFTGPSDDILNLCAHSL